MIEKTATADLARRLDDALAAIASAADDDAIERAADLRDEIIDQIERAPGSSLADLILKARACKAFYPDCRPFDPGEGASQDKRIASASVEGLATLAL